MTTLTRRARKLAVAAAGIAAACALTAPTAAAYASADGYTPNPHQWYFNNWDIQQKVWPTTQGAGVTVALVDTGVQANLPDLQGVVKPGADMLGDSGNGETDYGANGGHGTLMAELIAGQGIGSGQFGANPVGIAPQAKILPVHAISGAYTGTTPIATGIKYAVDHGADVINLSIGAPTSSPAACDPGEQQAISYALSRNVIVVAASGDSDQAGPRPEDPGTCAGVLTVGGVEQNGSLWSGSVQGPEVSVAAPGDQVYVTSDTGQQYSTGSHGTSGAAALTSAAAALIRSKYPSMPWYQVDQRLIDTAVPTGSVPNNGTGYGIIDINKALNTSPPASGPNPPYARYQAWLKSTGQASSPGSGTAAPPSGSKSSSGVTPMTLIVLFLIVAVLIAAVLIIVLATRNRSRRGPGGPGGFPPGGYAPPPGQYPQGQYPQPGQYAPPGQYPPPAGQQYPPPGQYPPPQQ